jgi:hypothetical protein
MTMHVNILKMRMRSLYVLITVVAHGLFTFRIWIRCEWNRLVENIYEWSICLAS